jgi:hypothetical protein
VIDASSDVRTVTISPAGIAAILAPTPMAGLDGVVGQYATQYNLDPNFFLSYVQWENAFLRPGTIGAAGNNPFDVTCVCGGSPGPFATGCVQYPGNSLCFNVYPSPTVGIQGAFEWASRWVAVANYQWGPLLDIASGNSPVFKANVLGQGNVNATLYPPSPCGPGFHWDNSVGGCVADQPPDLTGSTLIAALVGVGLLAGSYYVWNGFSFK